MVEMKREGLLKFCDNVFTLALLGCWHLVSYSIGTGKESSQGSSNSRSQRDSNAMNVGLMNTA